MERQARLARALREVKAEVDQFLAGHPPPVAAAQPHSTNLHAELAAQAQQIAVLTAALRTAEAASAAPPATDGDEERRLKRQRTSLLEKVQDERAELAVAQQEREAARRAQDAAQRAQDLAETRLATEQELRAADAARASRDLERAAGETRRWEQRCKDAEVALQDQDAKARRGAVAVVRCKELELELEALRRDTAARSDAAAHIGEVEALNARLTARFATYEQEKKALQGDLERLATLQAANMELEDKVKTLETALSNASRSQDVQSTPGEDWGATVERLCGERSSVALIRAWTKLKLDCQDAEMALAKLKVHAGTLEQQAKDASQRAETHSAGLHAEKLASAALRRSADDLEEEVRALRVKAGGKADAKADVPAAASNDKVRELEAQIAELQSTKTRLEEQLTAAEERTALLQTQFAAGGFDAASTKVLRLSGNPTSELARLKEENQQLAEQLQDLEARIRDAKPGDAPSASTRQLEAKIASLEAEKKTRAKEMAHLKKALQKYISEFREGIFMLLGWKVEMQGTGPEAEWHLKSRYHASDDELVFRLQSSAEREATAGEQKFNLAQTPWAQRLRGDRQAIAYLDVFGSIPGFLAQITVDIFSRNTLV